MLKLYNTLTRTKEEFRPLDPANVRVYVCGPTVYDFAHIGNARPVIVFDALYRLLRHLYGAGHVKYVRNITDVDDKINARAAEEYPTLPLNEAIREVTRKTEAQFHEDVAALGCLKPDVEPRATEHIEEMKVLIERLIKNGCAYVAESHVLFHVAAMKDYGKLANRSLDEMLAGARVEVAPYKRDAMDFVLWKPSKDGEPGWPSPAGISAPGRPGWHIECSAMSWKHLGEEFDIHGGGIDLVFPHHENELAQSRCAFHAGRMAQVWMHNGFLQVEGAKMSKSLGNFITIRELLRGEGRRPCPGEVIRLAMLGTHYRQPLDFNGPKLTYWRTKLSHWVDSYYLFFQTDFQYEMYLGSHIPKPSTRVIEALSDDLNFHEVTVFFDELAHRAVQQDAKAAAEMGENLLWLGLFRPRYVHAYEDHMHGSAKPQFLGKYRKEIEDARAIVLNEYNLSPDEHVRQESLRAVNNRLREVNLRMAGDGVTIAVNEHAVVSLESTKQESAFNQEDIEVRVAARNAARKAKDFKESDRIRDELKAMGVVLKDNKDGTTTWEVAR